MLVCHAHGSTVIEWPGGHGSGGDRAQLRAGRRGARAHPVRSEPRHRPARRAHRRAIARSNRPGRRADRRGAPRGRLRVNTDASTARLLLAPRLGAFLSANPEVSVELVVRDQLPDLVGEGFDLAVRFGEPEQAAVVARKLLETRIRTCATPAYLARRGRPRHPKDLEKHECILFRDPTTGRPFPWEFHRRGRVVRVPVSGRFTVNDGPSALAVCADGFGISQSIDRVVDDLLRSKVLVDLFPDWSEERFPVYLLYASRHLPPARLRAFVDFLVSLR